MAFQVFWRLNGRLVRNISTKSLFCRVDIPVDSLCSDYIKSEKQRKHNNYLKIRKTAKRGLKNLLTLPGYLFMS